MTHPADLRDVVAEACRALGGSCQEVSPGLLRAELPAPARLALDGPAGGPGLLAHPALWAPAGGPVQTVLYLALDEQAGAAHPGAERLTPGSERLDRLASLLQQRFGAGWGIVPWQEATRRALARAGRQPPPAPAAGLRPYHVYHYRVDWGGGREPPRWRAVWVDMVSGAAGPFAGLPPGCPVGDDPGDLPADPPRLGTHQAAELAWETLLAFIEPEAPPWADAARPRREREEAAVRDHFRELLAAAAPDARPALEAALARRLAEVRSRKGLCVRVRPRGLSLLYLPLLREGPGLFNPVLDLSAHPGPTLL